MHNFIIFLCGKTEGKGTLFFIVLVPDLKLAETTISTSFLHIFFPVNNAFCKLASTPLSIPILSRSCLTSFCDKSLIAIERYALDIFFILLVYILQAFTCNSVCDILHNGNPPL